MDEYFTRATIVKERVDRLGREGRAADAQGDTERAEALLAEMELAVRGLEEIREEQLISMLPKSKRPKRRWWRRATPLEGTERP